VTIGGGHEGASAGGPTHARGAGAALWVITQGSWGRHHRAAPRPRGIPPDALPDRHRAGDIRARRPVQLRPGELVVRHRGSRRMVSLGMALVHVRPHAQDRRFAIFRRASPKTPHSSPSTGTSRTPRRSDGPRRRPMVPSRKSPLDLKVATGFLPRRRWKAGTGRGHQTLRPPRARSLLTPPRVPSAPAYSSPCPSILNPGGGSSRSPVPLPSPPPFSGPQSHALPGLIRRA